MMLAKAQGITPTLDVGQDKMDPNGACVAAEAASLRPPETAWYCYLTVAGWRPCPKDAAGATEDLARRRYFDVYGYDGLYNANDTESIFCAIIRSYPMRPQAPPKLVGFPQGRAVILAIMGAKRQLVAAAGVGEDCVRHEENREC